MGRCMKAVFLLLIATNVFAFEELDENDLSEVTGQDGITIDRTYKVNIEEVRFVDGDGAGDGNPGAVVLKGIQVGDFIGADLQDNTAQTNGMVTVEGMKIDAVENGVLITHGRVQGRDIRIDAIEIGKSDGSGMGNVGSFQIQNQSNFLTGQQAADLNDRFGLGIDSTQ